MARPPMKVEDRAAIILARLKDRTLKPEAASERFGRAKRTAQRYLAPHIIEAIDYLIDAGDLQFGSGISSRTE